MHIKIQSIKTQAVQSLRRNHCFKQPCHLCGQHHVFLLPSLISPCKNIAVSLNPNHKCGANLVCQVEKIKQTKTPVFNLQKSGLVEHMIICSRSDLREQGKPKSQMLHQVSVLIIIITELVFNA